MFYRLFDAETGAEMPQGTSEGYAQCELANHTKYHCLILPIGYIVTGTGLQIAKYLAELEAEHHSWETLQRGSKRAPTVDKVWVDGTGRWTPPV